MARIAIVEDEEEHRLLLKRYIEQFVQETKTTIQVTAFSDGLSFLEGYGSGFDIVFLDIAMPHMDGLETAKKLRAIDKNVILIFVTSLAKYALKGYEVDAMDFLVKPIDYFHFYLRLDKALRIAKKAEKASLLLTTSEGKICVQVEDILYVESQLHYLLYHVGKECHKVRSTFKDLPDSLMRLPFVRSANSYLVNLNAVARVVGDSIQLLDGTKVPISRSRKKDFLQALAVFYGEKK